MADEGPPDDDYDRLLGSLGLPPIRDWPERHRGPDRRQQDRRELNLTTRRFLLEYFQELPPETLWLWFDGLVLGHATHRQLAILVDAVVQRERAQRARRAVPVGSGRPATIRLLPFLEPASNATIEAEWRLLKRQFKAFSIQRRHFHDQKHRTQRTDIRAACLRSPIGRRADGAQLFDLLFEDRAMTLGAMAARLVHRELELRLGRREARAREKANKALSPVSKEFHLIVAARTADDRRRRLGTWRTLFDKLNRQSRR